MLQAVDEFTRNMLARRQVIAAMTASELKQRYAGTAAGIFWSVAQPLALVLTYWFVFSVGFRVQAVGARPFIAFFICGFVPWTTFTEAVSGSIGSVVSAPHLVKKVVFPTEILPVVKLAAALVTHAILLIIALIIVLLDGGLSGWAILQLPYYFACGFCLALGIGWLLAALNVFFRDIGQIVPVILNVWFWLTPIAWPENILPQNMHAWLAVNPMYYVVQGYRDALLYGGVFWQRPVETLWFWAVTISILVAGAAVFRRLKPEFSDLL